MEELKPKIKVMCKLISKGEAFPRTVHWPLGNKGLLLKIQNEFKKNPGTDYLHFEHDKATIMNILGLCEQFLEKKGELTKENKKEVQTLIQKNVLSLSKGEREEIERHKSELKKKPLKSLLKELDAEMREGEFMHRFRLLASKELWDVDEKTEKGLKRAEAVEKVKMMRERSYAYGVEKLMDAVSRYFCLYDSKVPKLNKLLKKFPERLRTDYKEYRKKARKASSKG